MELGDVQKEQKGLVGKTVVDLVELSNYSVDAEGPTSAVYWMDEWD